MAFVVIDSVTKDYAAPGSGGSPAVADVSAVIAEGEFVCLMGASGSGKSTLLSMIGAMSRPTRGRILVDGIDVYGLSDEARADFRREYLGFVFQHHHLLPYLDAVQNVMLPLAPSRGSSHEKRERAVAVLARLGLSGKAKRLPSQLSGGEQGRVAIARALVNEPPLLLADEPTGALDSATGREIMEVFRDLNQQGQTIVMVTHNPDNGALADRILRMRDGRLDADTSEAPPGALRMSVDPGMSMGA